MLTFPLCIQDSTFILQEGWALRNPLDAFPLWILDRAVLSQRGWGGIFFISLTHCNTPNILQARFPSQCEMKAYHSSFLNPLTVFQVECWVAFFPWKRVYKCACSQKSNSADTWLSKNVASLKPYPTDICRIWLFLIVGNKGRIVKHMLFSKSSPMQSKSWFFRREVQSLSAEYYSFLFFWEERGLPSELHSCPSVLLTSLDISLLPEPLMRGSRQPRELMVLWEMPQCFRNSTQACSRLHAGERAFDSGQDAVQVKLDMLEINDFITLHAL